MLLQERLCSVELAMHSAAQVCMGLSQQVACSAIKSLRRLLGGKGNARIAELPLGGERGGNGAAHLLR